MAELIRIKKSLDIRMGGQAVQVYAKAGVSDIIGFNPDDFHGLLPKPLVKVGEKVKVGTVLFIDKKQPDVKIVSPVSGELVAINRGERRKILSIVVKNDGQMTQEALPAMNTSSSEEVKKSLADAGMFAFIKQRPYDRMANPNDAPCAIWVSSFDKAPLAPDFDFMYKDDFEAFQAGVDALAKIAPVSIGVEANSVVFNKVKNAKLTSFSGNYPSSNVGVQINKVAPINKGDLIWTITPQEIIYIGRYAKTGQVDFSKKVALVGPVLKKPAYYKTILGALNSTILADQVATKEKVRYIAGNPLTGAITSLDAFVGPFSTQMTVIEEGDDIRDFIGFYAPRLNKFSVSNLYLTNVIKKIFPKKVFDFDARVCGGERHMIMSGEYDKVFPMDIYPEFLIKAIIAGDIDKMEELGIYEVVPEDFAAAEFVCSSKMELQKIVRNGLDMMYKEMS